MSYAFPLTEESGVDHITAQNTMQYPDRKVLSSLKQYTYREQCAVALKTSSIVGGEGTASGNPSDKWAGYQLDRIGEQGVGTQFLLEPCYKSDCGMRCLHSCYTLF